MADSNTETYTTSWCSKISSSFQGICIGLILGVAGVGLLIWNEGRYVRQQKALEIGLRIVIDVPDANILDSSNDGKLIHIVGLGESYDTISDSTFGMINISNAMKLFRQTEMYQWVETEHTEETKNTGGSTTTKKTYTYDKKWRSSVINSKFFHDSSHTNPSSMVYESVQFQSRNVTVGAYPIAPQSPAVYDKMNWFEPFEEFDFSRSLDFINDSNLRNSIRVIGSGYYIGRNPNFPEIGDIRVSYSFVPSPLTVSIVARQYFGALTTFTLDNRGIFGHGGGSFILVESGIHDKYEMFAHAQRELLIFTWIMRLVGCGLVFIMFQSLAQPVVTLSSVIPLAGDVVETGTSCLSFMLALIVSGTVIAIAWFLYRPLFSLCLFGGIGILAYYIRSSRQKSTTTTEAAPSSNDYSYSGMSTNDGYESVPQVAEAIPIPPPPSAFMSSYDHNVYPEIPTSQDYPLFGLDQKNDINTPHAIPVYTLPIGSAQNIPFATMATPTAPYEDKQ